jgi:hypothetical protein
MFWGVFCFKKVPVIHIFRLPAGGEKKFWGAFLFHESATYASLIPLLPPLIKIFPQKENAKRKCGKVIFYVLELS